MTLDTHILLVQHLGAIPVSLLIDDIDVEFTSRQPYQVRTYIPFGETVEIPLTEAVLLSVLQGSLKQFSDSGYLSFALKSAGSGDADNYFEEYLYDSFGRVTNVTLWEDSSKERKIEEHQFSYDTAGKVTSEVEIVYGSGGSEILRRVYTYTYNDGDVSTIETEVVL